MNLDNRPDAMMLEGACVNYARAVQADGILQREGVTVTESVLGEGGEVVVLKVKKHPAVEISNSAWRLLRAFCSEFGLSPVARLRLSVERKDNPQETLASLLSRERPQREAKPAVM
jgi:P27 family predicted phage terminase small subunit